MTTETSGTPEAAETRFSALLDAAPDAIVSVDQDGRVLLVNVQAERLFGYDRDELVGEPVEVLVPEAARALHVAHRRRYLEHPATRPMGAGLPLTARRKDGSEFPAEISLSSLETEDGPVVTAVIRDGTERQQAAIVAASDDAIVAMDADGLVVSVNPAAERMLGGPAESLVHRLFTDLVPRPDRDRVGDLLRRVLAGQRVESPVRSTRLAADGRVLHVSSSLAAVRDAEGRVVGAAVIDRDVSDVVRSERERARAEELLQVILDQAGVVLMTTDETGVLTFYRAGRSIAEARADDAVGRSAELLYAGAPDVVALLRRALDGETVSAEVALHGRTMDVRFSPLTTGPDRRPHGVIGVAVDASERAREARTRRGLEERLRQSERLESLGRLAGGVAHDFNNLLAVILNYAELVADEVDGRVRADVDEIRAAAERAARLTKQLLVFSRRETVQPAPLDLNAVVRDVRTLLGRTIGEDVLLRVHLADALPPVVMDRGQCEQVLLNLAVNARDAMPDGGTLSVETTVTEVDADLASSRPGVEPGTYVVLSVSDTGVGMDAQTMEHAFEPFFTTKPKGSGTGLGLATVYGAVAEAGGTVSLYSEAGVGTTVRVYLPAAPQAAGRERPAGAPAAAPAEGRTVLVVEDEPAMRTVTARILRRHGYEVLEARDGEEALRWLETARPHLLLTDVVMPEMSGRELADRARAVRPALPVLFMSGYSRDVLGPQRRLDDDVVLVQKPFSAETLLARVDEVLGRAAGRD